MVHLFRNNGYNLILDVNSGSVHTADDAAYELIGLLNDGKNEEEAGLLLTEKYGAETVGEILDDVRALRESGALFSDDSQTVSQELFKKRKTVVKALCLHVAHDCNLACRYCFAGEGEYNGARGLMPYEVGRDALDFLIERSGNRKNLEVDFFGGEPLLNWDVVKKLVAYGRSAEEKAGKKFRFTVTTNGVLLNDEIMDFCNREMENVVLSVDGRKEIHDRMRPFRNGAGSYDRIVEKCLKCAESRGEKDYYVRGTFTHYNTDFARDVLHLADLGFRRISVEPVVAPANADYAIRESDLPVILEQYDILAAEMIKRKKQGRPFTFFHFMIDLSGGPCIYKRMAGCGSGTEYLAVTPNGDLYPCHQFAGDRDFRVGNVKEGITKPEITAKFAAGNVFTKPACANCFARFYCSGGCAANAFHSTGDLNGVYETGCVMQRKRVECALMIKAAEAGNNPGFPPGDR